MLAFPIIVALLGLVSSFPTNSCGSSSLIALSELNFQDCYHEASLERRGFRDWLTEHLEDMKERIQKNAGIAREAVQNGYKIAKTTVAAGYENAKNGVQTAVSKTKQVVDARITTPLKSQIAKICSSPKFSKEIWKPICAKHWEQNGRPKPPSPETEIPPWSPDPPAYDPIHDINTGNPVDSVDPNQSINFPPAVSGGFGDDPLSGDYPIQGSTAPKVDSLEPPKDTLRGIKKINGNKEAAADGAEGLSTGALAGIIIGCIAVLGVLVGGTHHIIRQKKKSLGPASSTAADYGTSVGYARAPSQPTLPTAHFDEIEVV